MIEYQVRALLTLRAFGRTALYPAPVEALHTVSFLADALAETWQIRPLDSAVLKTGWVPRSSGLQAAMDSLVGMGLLAVTRISYAQLGDRFVVRAAFATNKGLADRVFDAIDDSAGFVVEDSALSEIAFSVAGMGADGMTRAALVDATYSDPLLDVNSVMELSTMASGRPSRTVQAGRTLADLARERIGHSLSPAEVTSLYVRHLFSLTSGDPT